MVAKAKSATLLLLQVVGSTPVVEWVGYQVDSMTVAAKGAWEAGIHQTIGAQAVAAQADTPVLAALVAQRLLMGIVLLTPNQALAVVAVAVA